MRTRHERKTLPTEDFLFIHGWFDEYRDKFDERFYTFKVVLDWLLCISRRSARGSLGERFYTFKLALNWFLQHDGENIVETGSLREPESWFGVGCSTYVFSEFIAKYGGHLWTCDNSNEVIETAKRQTREFRDNITYVCSDSVEFLQGFDDSIDLLYLDSMDCPRTSDASEAQQHNLRELQAALPKLTEHAIVLLDDNRFCNGGKTRLSKQYLHDNNWICLFDWHQSVWTRCQY